MKVSSLSLQEVVQPYAASGPITNNSNRVTLTGVAPLIDPKSCRILGEQEKTLIFDHPG